MSTQATRIQVSNIVVGTEEWVPIVSPVDCDYFAIWNVPGGWKGHGSSNVILCSDPDDENSQKPLSNGAQEIVAAPSRLRVANGSYVTHRFLAGDVLFYAKAVFGDTILIVTCLQ